ncbi:glycosyltransferase family 90 protein [Poronia punctata]|nr:glycosyltransferase family 90 protein [Poronia punctata]
MSQTWKAGRRQGLEPLSTSTTRTVDPLTWSAGAALVCGVAAHYLGSRQTEIASELLCWIFLPLIFDKANHQRLLGLDRHDGTLPSHDSSKPAAASGSGDVPVSSIWIVAICIAICSVFRSERDIIVLFPLLVPLLLISQRWLQYGVSPIESHGSIFFRLANTTIGATLSAIFAVFTLSPWDPFGYGLSLVPVSALLIAYTLLGTRSERLPKSIETFDIEAALRPLSFRVAATLAVMLGVESVVLGFPSINVFRTVASGVAKALAWYSAVQLAQHSSWSTATMASTFSLLATRSPFSQETGIRAIFNVSASLLALGQTVDMLPKQARTRSMLWAAALVPVLPYLANLMAINSSRSSGVTHMENHPVEILINEAKFDFDKMLENQSNSFSAAYDEYQRRYGYDPPYGFEEWYNFAKSHQSPIIDEFDTITESIKPFLRISGQEVLDLMTRAYSLPEHELWRCTLAGHPSRTYCSHPRRSFDRDVSRFFDHMIRKLPSLSLNVKLLINHLDEPAVLIPPDPSNVNLNITNLAGQPSWETLTKHCSSLTSTSTTTTTSNTITPIETYGLPFIRSRKSALDLCTHPEYNQMHGFLLAPESLRLIEGIIPVLSTAAPSTMGDILYPLAAYTQDPNFRYDGGSGKDIPWEEKHNNLYWAGSNTGGRASKDDHDWRLFHRQRFVEMAQNLQQHHRPYQYLREANKGLVSRISSSFLNSRLYNVAFARIFQCEPRSCRDQRAYFHQKPWAEASRPLQSRLVFDIDGNGISGRYYKLLTSKSTPLKQTIFREWHDDRLLPWIHYVPVSLSMDELPELVHYLTSTESGQLHAKKIAEQGRRWFGKAMREIDMAVYVYRLLLELARVQDPDRPAMSFDLG